MKTMKLRFKNLNMNKIYNNYIRLPQEAVDRAMLRKSSGSSGDMAFKAGYRGLKNNLFPINSPLYAIYVAGKEYVKINQKKL